MRQRPRSRCPDNGVEFFAGERGVELCRDRRAGVLYPTCCWCDSRIRLRLRRARSRMHAPVDGAQTLVDELHSHKKKESGEHHRLVLRRHRRDGLSTDRRHRCA